MNAPASRNAHERASAIAAKCPASRRDFSAPPSNSSSNWSTSAMGAGQTRRVCGARPSGPQPLAATMSTSIPAPCRDLRRRRVHAVLEVVRPEHDDHQIERLVGQEGGEEQLAPIAVRLERVVPHGRASAEAFLDDPVALAELAPQHAGPARVRRKPLSRLLSLERDAAPGVRVAVAEDVVIGEPYAGCTLTCCGLHAYA